MGTHQQEILLTLQGDMRQFDAVVIAESLRHLANLVESFPSHEGRAKLATLRQGSAVTGVLTNDRTASSLEAGLIDLRDSARVPDAWSMAQVRSLERIIETTAQSDLVYINVAAGSSIVLDTHMKEATSKALKSLPKSLGSVVGELTRYNGSGQTKTAGLVQEDLEKTVEISLEQDLWQLVAQYMHQRVEVTGILTRHPETHAIERVSARSITPLPARGALVSGIGIWETLASHDESAEES